MNFSPLKRSLIYLVVLSICSLTLFIAPLSGAAAGDSSVKVADTDIRLGMTKQELNKRLSTKYSVIEVPVSEKQEVLAAEIFDMDKKTSVGRVHFQGDRIVGVSRFVSETADKSAIAFADALRDALMSALKGKESATTIVRISSNRGEAISTDSVDFRFDNRFVSLQIVRAQFGNKNLGPEVWLHESILEIPSPEAGGK